MDNSMEIETADWEGLENTYNQSPSRSALDHRPLSTKIEANQWSESMSSLCFIIAGDNEVPPEQRRLRDDYYLFFTSDEVLPGYNGYLRKNRRKECNCNMCGRNRCGRCDYSYNTYLKSLSTAKSKTIFGESANNANLCIHHDLWVNDLYTFIFSITSEIRYMFWKDYDKALMNIVAHFGLSHYETYVFIPSEQAIDNYYNMIISMIITIKEMVKVAFSLNPSLPETYKCADSEYLLHHTLCAFLRHTFEIDYNDECMLTIVRISLFSEMNTIDLALPIPLTKLFSMMKKQHIYEIKRGINLKAEFELFMTTEGTAPSSSLSLLDALSQLRTAPKKISRMLYYLALTDGTMYGTITSAHNEDPLRAFSVIIDKLKSMDVLPKHRNVNNVDFTFVQAIVEFVIKEWPKFAKYGYYYCEKERIRFHFVRKTLEKSISDETSIKYILCTGLGWNDLSVIYDPEDFVSKEVANITGAFTGTKRKNVKELWHHDIDFIRNNYKKRKTIRCANHESANCECGQDVYTSSSDDSSDF